MAIKRWNASTSQWELVGTPGTATPAAIGAAALVGGNAFSGNQIVSSNSYISVGDRSNIAVSGANPLNGININNSSSRPRIGFFDSVGGDTTGSSLGTIEFFDYLKSGQAEKRSALIEVIRDGASSTQRGGAIVFNTVPNASNSITERMRITSSGNVGIGRTPHFNNTLETTGLISARTSGTGGNTEVWAQAHDFWETPTYTGVGLRYWGTAVAGNRVTGIPLASLGEVGFQNVNSALVHTNSAPLAFASYSVEGMRLAQNQYLLVGYTSSNGAYRLQVNSQIFATSSSIATSDGRFKDNVLPISSGLDIIDSLNPVSFDWKEHPVHNFVEGKTVGFIAQEVKEALKDYEWVNNIIKTNMTEAVLDEDGNEVTPAEEFLGIAESNIIPLLVAAVKELRAEVNTLKAQITN
jgi:hypothetical protein